MPDSFKDFLIWQTEIGVADCNETRGLSLLIQSLIIEEKKTLTEYASIFFICSQTKQFATQ